MNELKEQEEEEQAGNLGKIASVPPGLQHQQSTVGYINSSDSDGDENKEEGQIEGVPKSPGMNYAQATHKLSNVDRLAVMLSASNMPKLRSINEGKKKKKKMNNDDDEKVPAPPPPPPGAAAGQSAAGQSAATVKETKTKIVSSGVDAELNKTTTTNTNNAKSKRKKRTRKKLDI
mmetsp:Transcript_72416/g.65116  ORF Transcript_72416/g.65116 Transcript_72416/m.65116 type:complete len:175 (-) Transcript_72416:282-806(-)|eukprot:CAMPEP_0201571332 /NCGR_PEP_ID=MMETSP0190_2-20130828/14056_1 /ASSEMBLY_ACC=CAM_ASM_000263 /TAXON_ID=37353 /ORGANISM="Rosalina sp." /LENGTH=174 /DNA_ID=CAMNT_0047995867 /DNA_START=509 /DNA_END=1033 /DNA_ORIENTATION=+